MKNLFFAIIVAISFVAPALAQETQTFVVGRTGVQDDASTTYHIVEVFQQRGRWIFPDVGYIDFADAKGYREVFVGFGGVLYSSKRITVLHEVYLDKATGPSSGGALYFQPWTLVDVNLTPKLSG